MPLVTHFALLASISDQELAINVLQELLMLLGNVFIVILLAIFAADLTLRSAQLVKQASICTMAIVSHNVNLLLLAPLMDVLTVALFPALLIRTFSIGMELAVAHVLILYNKL